MICKSLTKWLEYEVLYAGRIAKPAIINTKPTPKNIINKVLLSSLFKLSFLTFPSCNTISITTTTAIFNSFREPTQGHISGVGAPYHTPYTTSYLALKSLLLQFTLDSNPHGPLRAI